MRYASWIILALFVGSNGMGDPAALESIAGEHVVFSVNGDTQLTGIVTIQATGPNRGFSLGALPLASHPVTPVSVLSEADATTFTQQDGKITQHLPGGESIVYETFDGYLTLSFSLEGQAQSVSAGNRRSMGTLVDSESFFTRLDGNYLITLAGGIAPKPENAYGLIYRDTLEGMTVTPYCPPNGGFCDSGYNFFNYANTQVFQRAGLNGAKVFDLFVKIDGKLEIYRWTEAQGKGEFVNFQYVLNGNRVCLEHVMELMQ